MFENVKTCKKLENVKKSKKLNFNFFLKKKKKFLGGVTLIVFFVFFFLCFFIFLFQTFSFFFSCFFFIFRSFFFNAFLCLWTLFDLFLKKNFSSFFSLFHFFMFHIFCFFHFLGGITVFPYPFGSAAFLLLLWVTLLFPAWSLPFGWRLLFPLLGGTAWSHPPLDGVTFSLSLCVVLLSFCPFGEAAFSPVWCWVVLLGLLLPSVWFCCVSFSFWLGLPSPPLGETAFSPSLLLGGAAWSPPLKSVAVFPSPFAWCCLVSSFFGWCCCFFILLFGGVVFLILNSGAAWSPPILRWSCVPLFFSWAVLLCVLLLCVVLLFFLLLLRGVVILLLLWVKQLFSPVFRWVLLRALPFWAGLEVSLSSPTQRSKGRQHHAKREGKNATPPKRKEETKQHHAKREAKRNTTQRRRRPSSTTQQKTRQTHHHT